MNSRPSNGGTGRPAYRPPLRWLRALAVPASLLLAAPPAAQAQEPAATVGEVTSGSELERYLRTLQVAGKSPRYPWSIRGFSVGEADRLAPRDSLHPWSDRYELRAGDGVRLHLHPVQTRTVFNSAFPYGGGDGAVWAGRGLTTAVEAGLTAHYRWFTLTLAPVAFRSENASFDLNEHVLSAEAPYADWRRPTQIDLPQRFGEGAYSRVDPGQSTLRADVAGLTAGVSTSNQYWGPANDYPLIQGNNAPGFLHGFAGTSRPVNLWIGRFHARAFWGRLYQSAFSPSAPDSAVRFGTGVVGVFTPRGVPGLELGASRFFHMTWPHDGLGGEEVFKPLETFFKVNLYNVIVDGDTIESQESVAANQLASLFGRWVFPESGLELYGELATEDHRHNLRDWLLEPDHNVAYTLGFRKVWARDERRLWAVRGEHLTGEPSHLERTRRQSPFYVHSWTRQGHTSRGQILGTPAAYGGAASTLAADYYHPEGRLTGFWRRTVRQEGGRFLQTGEIESLDVMQSLGAEALVFSGRWELHGALEGVYNFNRNFESDVANLSASLGVRARL